jgi:hypothetical protein
LHFSNISSTEELRNYKTDALEFYMMYNFSTVQMVKEGSIDDGCIIRI